MTTRALPFLAVLMLLGACVPEPAPEPPFDGVTLEVDAAAPDGTHPDGWFCDGEPQARYAAVLDENGGFAGLDLLVCVPGAAFDFNLDAACEQPAGDLEVSAYLNGAFPVGEGEVPIDGETFDRRGLVLAIEHADSGNHATVLEPDDPYANATVNVVGEAEGSLTWTDVEWGCALGGVGSASSAEVVVTWDLDDASPVEIHTYADEP
ncbi:MAG: hypothetical protein GY898_15585 [Proteobacteria bacterium]|nr:hypothetical protein [Pseudomonadota bacterium]